MISASLSFFLLCWCSSYIFSKPFLVNQFTNTAALCFLHQAAVSIAPSSVVNISCGFFDLPREGVESLPILISALASKYQSNSSKLCLISKMPIYLSILALLNGY